MPAAFQSKRCRTRLIGGGLLLHLLAVIILSVAPDLHALLHDHAHDEDHVCAVTLFRDGGVEPGIETPWQTVERYGNRLPVVQVETQEVAPLALIGKIRERGPPEGV